MSKGNLGSSLDLDSYLSQCVTGQLVNNKIILGYSDVARLRTQFFSRTMCFFSDGGEKLPQASHSFSF